VASNLDATVPTERGLLPGNGALVSVICTATGRRPVEAGKPERALHEESIRRSGARRPLIVGDRLDTDIEAGARWGTPSLLVFTGVTDPAELLGADEVHRPSLLAKDLTGLLVAHPPVTLDNGGWCCGRWRAVADQGVLRLTGVEGREARSAGSRGGPQPPGAQRTGGGEAAAELDHRATKSPDSAVQFADQLTEDGLDALRAAAVASWQAVDGGSPVREVVGAPPGSSLPVGPVRR
jgi:hypothetical protein